MSLRRILEGAGTLGRSVVAVLTWVVLYGLIGGLAGLPPLLAGIWLARRLPQVFTEGWLGLFAQCGLFVVLLVVWLWLFFSVQERLPQPPGPVERAFTWLFGTDRFPGEGQDS